MKDHKRDVRKTFRLPSFLVKRIEEKNNLPKCKSANDKYVFFLETGVNAFGEFEKTISDPEYRERANTELQNLFVDGLIVENLMGMDASKLKGLAMAVDLVRGKRKI